MKKRSILISILLFLCNLAFTAVYVKGIHHFDSYYSYGVVHPESDRVDEWWFDKDKVSFITSDWHLILDKEKQHIITINRREKTYTLIPLPVTVSSHLAASMIEVMKNYHLDGIIKKKENREKAHERVCDQFEVSEWLIY